MASPQKENGYTAIANEIMDALCRIRIPGEERQILDCIFRKTYGWNKCEDSIALQQFVSMTGISKQHVIRAIHGLLSKKIISVAEKGNEPAKVYKFIKDYHLWESLPKKVTLPKKATFVAKKGNLPLPKMGTTKDTITKDNTKTNNMVENEFKPKEKDDVIPYQEIIEYLNKKANKHFDYKTESTRKLIKARWGKNGNSKTIEDFFTVIDNKCSDWLHGEISGKPASKYLRPETLFGNKFESYLNESPITEPNNPWERP